MLTYHGYEALPIKRYNFQIINKMSKENKTSDKPQNGNDFIADVSHSANREEAIKWFKSLPFLRARSYAINHTNRFIRQPFTELTGREMQEIWSQHCG